MIDEKLLSILTCPACKSKLIKRDDHLYCSECGNRFEIDYEKGYIDMRPPKIEQKDSIYGDEEFIKERDILNPGPPFLSGGIKNWIMKSMVGAADGDTILDAGCGAGRYMLWNKGSGAELIGIDQESFFAPSVLDSFRLVQGYLHYMPFSENSFNSIISLDVIEHMGLNDIKSFLSSARKILKPGGKLFIYTNSTESSALAPLIRFRQRISEYFAKKGLIDFHIEDESKEDHINAIKTKNQLVELAAENGLRLTDSIYYNPVIMGWFENLFLKLFEGLINKKQSKKTGKEKTELKMSKRHPKSYAKQRMKQKARQNKLIYSIFWLITVVMKLDIIFFSNVKSGQFFLLFEAE